MYSYCIVFILDVRTKGQPDKRMDGHTDGRTSVCRDSFPRPRKPNYSQDEGCVEISITDNIPSWIHARWNENDMIIIKNQIIDILII